MSRYCHARRTSCLALEDRASAQTLGCTNALAWGRHDYCPASESWRLPTRRPSLAGTGWPRLGAGGVRSSISAEGTAGNSPGIHSWGSVARADMRSRESRRDDGGSAGLVFRRPYGTRDECSSPCRTQDSAFGSVLGYYPPSLTGLRGRCDPGPALSLSGRAGLSWVPARAEGTAGNGAPRCQALAMRWVRRRELVALFP